MALSFLYEVLLVLLQIMELYTVFVILEYTTCYFFRILEKTVFKIVLENFRK